MRRPYVYFRMEAAKTLSQQAAGPESVLCSRSFFAEEVVTKGPKGAASKSTKKSLAVGGAAYALRTDAGTGPGIMSKPDESLADKDVLLQSEFAASSSGSKHTRHLLR